MKEHSEIKIGEKSNERKPFINQIRNKVANFVASLRQKYDDSIVYPGLASDEMLIYDLNTLERVIRGE